MTNCLKRVGNLYALSGSIEFRKFDKMPHEQNLKNYYSVNIIILFLNMRTVLHKQKNIA